MQLIFQEKEREAMAVMDKESYLREEFDVRERQKAELGREIEEISTQIEHTLVPAYTRLQQSNLSYRCVTPCPFSFSLLLLSYYDSDDEYTNLCNLCFLLLSIHVLLTFHVPSPSPSFIIPFIIVIAFLQ